MGEWQELKTITDVAAAQAVGMEIEVYVGCVWEPWLGKGWINVAKYRARPRKPEVETFDAQLDAARYRWLRDVAYNATAGPNGEMIWCVTGEGGGKVEPIHGQYLDDAIDAKIGATKQPAKVMVKSLCWRDSRGGALFWRDELAKVPDVFKRFPAGDLTGEVEE